MSGWTQSNWGAAGNPNPNAAQAVAAAAGASSQYNYGPPSAPAYGPPSAPGAGQQQQQQQQGYQQQQQQGYQQQQQPVQQQEQQPDERQGGNKRPAAGGARGYHQNKFEELMRATGNAPADDVTGDAKRSRTAEQQPQQQQQQQPQQHGSGGNFNAASYGYGGRDGGMPAPSMPVKSRVSASTAFQNFGTPGGAGQNDSRKKTKVCGNFRDGSCRYGDRCLFLHPEDARYQEAMANGGALPGTGPVTSPRGSQNGVQPYSSNTAALQQGLGFARGGVDTQKPQFFKTRICNNLPNCPRGDSCNFLHPADGDSYAVAWHKANPADGVVEPAFKRKSKICKGVNQGCDRGKDCAFLHPEDGEPFIRLMKIDRPYYKSKPCRNIMTGNPCPRYPHCDFLHPGDDGYEAATDPNYRTDTQLDSDMAKSELGWAEAASNVAKIAFAAPPPPGSDYGTTESFAAYQKMERAWDTIQRSQELAEKREKYLEKKQAEIAAQQTTFRATMQATPFRIRILAKCDELAEKFLLKEPYAVAESAQMVAAPLPKQKIVPDNSESNVPLCWPVRTGNNTDPYTSYKSPWKAVPKPPPRPAATKPTETVVSAPEAPGTFKVLNIEQLRLAAHLSGATEEVKALGGDAVAQAKALAAAQGYVWNAEQSGYTRSPEQAEDIMNKLRLAAGIEVVTPAAIAATVAETKVADAVHYSADGKWMWNAKTQGWVAAPAKQAAGVHYSADGKWMWNAQTQAWVAATPQ